jgi:hypothetical protein
LGWDAGAGLIRDLQRSKSPKRLKNDIGWASRRMSSEGFGYTGQVVLLFCTQVWGCCGNWTIQRVCAPMLPPKAVE